MWKVPLFALNYDENETKAVNEVLESQWLTTGAKTAAFEENFKKYLGNDIYCLAVSNCTAALHLSLLVNDIKEGDEVILSGLTFVAALNVTHLTGATPVIADSKSFADWNVSPADIESKITDKTKAIIVVHFAGYPCDMEEISVLAKKHNLILIEDVAHAIGADYKGKKCGTIGDIGCFSFFSNKNLSVGEGGMITTKNKAVYEKLKLLRSHGMTSMTIERHNSKTISYNVATAGFNYRIDEIRSALGIEQLKKLDNSNLKRKQLVERYHQELANCSSIIIPWTNQLIDRTSSYHIFPILLPENVDRKEIMEKLKEKGIQSSIHYPAFNSFSYYESLIKEDVKVANKISSRVLTLPLYPTMTFDNVVLVCDAIKELLK